MKVLSACSEVSKSFCSGSRSAESQIRPLQLFLTTMLCAVTGVVSTKNNGGFVSIKTKVCTHVVLTGHRHCGLFAETES